MARRTTTSHSSTSASSESRSESISESTSRSENYSQGTSRNESHSQSTSVGTSQSVSRGQSTSTSTNTGRSQSESTSRSESITQKVLDEEMLERILSGLTQQMTDEQIETYAENLLAPVLHAQLEESQQEYEAARLGREQEIENLAQLLGRDIAAQNAAYRQGRADIETDALARGMGRSSYTLQTLAEQGEALAQAVRELTDENTRKTEQIHRQITLAADQNAQTQGRLRENYAQSLAAKVQELKEQQRQRGDSQYLTAISAALGQKTTNTGTQTATQTQTGSTHTSGEQSSMQNTASTQKENTDGIQSGTSSTSGTATQTGTQHTTGTQASNSSSSTDTVSTTSTGGGSSKTRSSSGVKDVINKAASAVAGLASKLKK